MAQNDLPYIDARYVAPFIPERPTESHKGDYGFLLVIAGSQGLTGAAALTCQAALRAGAGMVTLGIPRSLHPIMAVKLTEVMTSPLPETDTCSLSLGAEEPIMDLAEDMDVVAMGPGLSRHTETEKLVQRLVPALRRSLVLDADALNALSSEAKIFSSVSSPVVITPHPGEMSRLVGRSILEIQKDRVGITAEYAQRWQVIVVLKGAPTVVASPFGEIMLNSSGNPGMASAGSGDVLTGIIAGMLAQKLTPWRAATLGAYLHGLAGDIAARAKTQWGMTSGDILDSIPAAWKVLEGQR